MSSESAGTDAMADTLTKFGDALGQMRQRMISGGVPDHVADQVLTDFAREFARGIGGRMSVGLPRPRRPDGPSSPMSS